MLNIHPSLLPAFPGLHTHARALAAGVKLHGCTVHLVTQRMDEGPILAQAAVPVLADDTEETLADRVLVQEHAIYPAALAGIRVGPCHRRGRGGRGAFEPLAGTALIAIERHQNPIVGEASHGSSTNRFPGT
jgi:folate-dependent phosphoribosylglycinamide formyltransferase PurN